MRWPGWWWGKAPDGMRHGWVSGLVGGVCFFVTNGLGGSLLLSVLVNCAVGMPCWWVLAVHYARRDHYRRMFEENRATGRSCIPR